MLKKLSLLLILVLIFSTSSIMAFEYDPSVIDWNAVEDEVSKQNFENNLLDKIDFGLKPAELVVKDLEPVKFLPELIQEPEPEIEDPVIDKEQFVVDSYKVPIVQDFEPNFEKLKPNYDDLWEKVEDFEPVDEPVREPEPDYPNCSSSLYGQQEFRCAGNMNFQLDDYFCHPHNAGNYVHCIFLGENDDEPTEPEEPSQPNTPNNPSNPVADEPVQNDEPEIVYPNCSSAMSVYAEFRCSRSGSFSLNGYSCHLDAVDVHHCIQLPSQNTSTNNSNNNSTNRSETVYYQQPSAAGSANQYQASQQSNNYPSCSSALSGSQEFYCIGSSNFTLSGYSCHTHGDLVHCEFTGNSNVQNSSNYQNQPSTQSYQQPVYYQQPSVAGSANQYRASQTVSSYPSCNYNLSGYQEFYCIGSSNFSLSGYSCHTHGELVHCEMTSQVQVQSQPQSQINSGTVTLYQPQATPVVASSPAQVVQMPSVADAPTCNNVDDNLDEFYCRAGSFEKAGFNCHKHGELFHCVKGAAAPAGSESGFSLVPRANADSVNIAATQDPPPGCHYHGDHLHCEDDESSSGAELVAPDGCHYFQGVLYCEDEDSADGDEDDVNYEEVLIYVLAAFSTILFAAVVYLVIRKNA